jgi:hypothetical protein
MSNCQSHACMPGNEIENVTKNESAHNNGFYIPHNNASKWAICKNVYHNFSFSKDASSKVNSSKHTEKIICGDVANRIIAF